jgi:ABC-type uncharacterized transport system involved in gliding motility auxiliary subunit
MNPKLRRYAWIGLAVSAAAAIFAIVYYFLFRQFNVGVEVGIGLAVIGLATYALLDPQRLQEVLTGRQMKYGSNMAVFVIAVLGILVVINFLANKYPQKWDLTEDQTNTLSKESIRIVQALPDKVEALGFFSKNSDPTTAKTLMENFKVNSKGKFDYRLVDPETDPVTTQKYNVNSDGTIILEMGNHIQSTKVVSEDEIATGLLKLTNPTSSVVYFLTGHGEHDPITSSDDSMATAASILEKKNYTIKPLNLLTDPKIPDDASVIVIAGPQKPISTDEIALLKAYMSKGKSLVVMEDSTIATSMGDSDDPLANYLQSDWGITLGKDFVLDMSSTNLSQALANKYGNHPIVTRLAGMVTVFPSARSVTIANPAPQNITLTELVMTSSNSWAETDLANLKNNKYQFDSGADLQGPVPLAAAGVKSGTKARVVVVGSSYFAVDKNFNVYGNGDFLVNSIDWSAENESLINLTPKQSTNRVVVAPSTLSMSLIFLASVIAFPLLIIIIGIAVWVQRRKQG